MLHIKLYLKSSDLNAYKVAKEINGKVLDVKNGFHTEAVITKDISEIVPLKLAQTRLVNTLKKSLSRMVTYVGSSEWSHKDTLWREEIIIVMCNKNAMSEVISEFNDYELVDTLLTKNCTLKFIKKYTNTHRFTELKTDRSITVIRNDILQDKSYV